jgi:hypothetical protein
MSEAKHTALPKLELDAVTGEESLDLCWVDPPKSMGNPVSIGFIYCLEDENDRREYDAEAFANQIIHRCNHFNVVVGALEDLYRLILDTPATRHFPPDVDERMDKARAALQLARPAAEGVQS